MAWAPDPAQQGTYTYEDWLATPEGAWCELIDGRLHRWADPDGLEGAEVSVPRTRHQRVAGAVFVHLHAWAQRHGGEAFFAAGVRLGRDLLVVPDAVLVSSDRLHLLGERHVDGAPDLVVEVSSPSTFRHDRIRKRRIYEQAGVPEYWFVDLDAEAVEVYRLGPDGYGPPEVVDRGGVVRSGLPDLDVEVTTLLA